MGTFLWTFGNFNGETFSVHSKLEVDREGLLLDSGAEFASFFFQCVDPVSHTHTNSDYLILFHLLQ